MVLSEIQKYELIYKHVTLKLSIRQIAKDMNISKNTVSLWIKRYDDDKNIKRKKGSGIKN